MGLVTGASGGSVGGGGGRGGGGAGGGGSSGSGFGGRGFPTGLAPSSPPPTNVAPARFEATVYELEIPENRIADLDAAKLESTAATPQALAAALAAFGTPKILYKVDQTVNLYGENITLASQEPMITGRNMRVNGSGFSDVISYTSIGLIIRMSAAAPPNNSRRGDAYERGSGGRGTGLPPNGSRRGDPNVQLNFQLSVMADTSIALTESLNATRVRSLQLSQSGTPKFGKPSVLVAVNAAGAGEKSRPVAYIVRYVFTQPKT